MTGMDAGREAVYDGLVGRGRVWTKGGMRLSRPAPSPSPGHHSTKGGAGDLREWDCGSFDSPDGRFWNRVTVRAVPAGYEVVLVSFDRGRGMRRTEQSLGTYQDLALARAAAWSLTDKEG